MPPTPGAARGVLAPSATRSPHLPAIARWESEPAPPMPPAGQNAADVYKNAFALFDQLTAEEKEILRDPKKAVDAEKAAALLGKIQPILELLREAAQMPECDWALGPIGPDTEMPHLSKAMQLAHLARWAATQQFPTNPDAALDDLLAAAHLGRQMSGTVIGLMVEKAIDSLVIDPVRAHLASLPPSTADRLAELMELRTVETSVQEAFKGELAFFRNATAKLLSSEEDREKFLREIAAPGGDPTAAEPLRRLAADPAALRAEVEFVTNIHQQMGEAMRWPEARFNAWWTEMEASLRSDRHSLARVLLPAFGNIYPRLQQARIQGEMLAAALAVMQGGPEALSAFRDPATEQPFTIVEKPEGFEIQSTFLVRKKPLSMFFPTAPPSAGEP